MGKAMKRAAIYLRVSTQDQTTSNQEHELRQAAERADWQMAKVYRDHGISGAKGRNGRPAFDALCRDATKRQFDVVMAWNVDRLGRSLKDLVAFLSELHALGIDLFLHQQGLDTTTPAGKAMFQMLGVFAEFERSIIQERVRAGLQRAKREGKRLGRPPIADKLAERIRAALAGGMSVRKTAAKFAVNPSTVQRVAHPFEGADNASVAGAAQANKGVGPAASIGWNASRPGVSERPLGGGRAKIENSSRRHPRKFGLKRFLAVRRSWRGNGVACFWATSLEKIFGGVIAIISLRPGRWMQQSAVPRRAILSVGSTGGIGQ